MFWTRNGETLLNPSREKRLKKKLNRIARATCMDPGFLRCFPPLSSRTFDPQRTGISLRAQYVTCFPPTMVWVSWMMYTLKSTAPRPRALDPPFPASFFAGSVCRSSFPQPSPAHFHDKPQQSRKISKRPAVACRGTKLPKTLSNIKFE